MNTYTGGTKTVIGIAILLAVLIGLSDVVSYGHVENETIVVNRLDMQQEVNGSDGDVSTSYHYRVYSDKGLYEIDQSGFFFAHPELISAIHEGDTVNVVSRGFNCPQLGIYRKIVEIK